MNAREAMQRALDALEVGDQNFAVDTLIAGLAEPPPTTPAMEPPRTFLCRVCGLACEWPGVRSHHELLAHGYDHDYETREAA